VRAPARGKPGAGGAARPPDPRGLAYRVLMQGEAGRGANEALDQALERSALDERDRSLVTALVDGTLRWRARLDHVLAHYSKYPLADLPTPILTILRLGAFQMLCLERVPASAAVNEAVRLARRWGHAGTAGLVNALLRRVAEHGTEVPFPDPEQDPAGYLAVAYSHPRWLVERWLARWGYEDTLALVRVDNEPAPLDLRANRLRTSRDGLAALLRAEGVETAPGALAPDCLQVTAGAAGLRRTRAWAEGMFSIQGQGSMLVGYLASPMPGWKVSDLAAGTGGKATHLAELMDGRGRVTAYDKAAARLQVLGREAARLGLEIAAICADATTLPPTGDQDLVLVDAPCSGTGALRRRPDARWRKQERQLVELSALQQALLVAADGLLHKGGHLIYTTCSLEPEENEHVVAAFLATHPHFRQEDCRQALPFLPAEVFAEGGRAVRLLPHRHNTDGMFMVSLRKAEAGSGPRR